LKTARLRAITSAKVLSFENGTVVYEGRQKHSIEADTVAIAAGYKANTTLYDQLSDKVDCALVGDAENPDNILSAVHMATMPVRCMLKKPDVC
jgi:NADH dehydrogenase FAD-containing subunit